MSVSRYPLNGNLTPTQTGTELLTGLSGATAYKTTPTNYPTPPNGYATVLELSTTGIVTHTETNPCDNGGGFYDFEFYKVAGSAVQLYEFVVAEWSYAGMGFGISPSGGVGPFILDNTPLTYSDLDPTHRTADGVVPDNQWHRVRLEFKPTTGFSVAKLFLGNNRYQTTPDYTVNYVNDLYSAGTVYGNLGSNGVGSPVKLVMSDLATGLYVDTPPVRGVVSSGEFSGIIPI